MNEQGLSLSKKERLILSNQLKILAALAPEEEEAEYRGQIRILEEGYALHYGDLFTHIYDEFSADDCREVFDILDMYRALTFSYQAIPDKEDIEPERIKFHGFDGNNETTHMAYTRFLINDQGRYQELKGDEEEPSFNSHAYGSLDRYRAMVRIWQKEFGKSSNLTREQILKILDAR